MEPEAVKLMTQTLEKNAIDKSEYPRTTEIENRCVNMIADLWHAPNNENSWELQRSALQKPACWVVWP